MVELVANIVIVTGSTLLSCYWFRYTCLLILAARTTRDYAAEVALANQLCFPKVAAKLREPNVEDFDLLHHCLDREYAVITDGLERMKRSNGEVVLERLILAIDYRIMNVWYCMTRRFSVEAASHALQEMALVVAHFANDLGERAEASAG